MNQKRKAQRERRAAQEEANAKRVIKWICIALVAIALIYALSVSQIL